ncbi:MAG TPA: hypothetical protein VI727_08015 [Candidatus Brocadiaceae bacterium]|nr:hypothetical protein [Candidatus Brocadiaceae bacterium]
MSFKAILDSPRPLKSGLVTVTMTCKKSDLHSIVDLMGLTVTVYGENEAQITDDRAVSLARIRSLAEQVAEAIDKELQANDDSEAKWTTGLMTAMEFEKESGK